MSHLRRLFYDAFERGTGCGVEFLRHAAREIRLPSRDDRIFHGRAGGQGRDRSHEDRGCVSAAEDEAVNICHPGGGAFAAKDLCIFSAAGRMHRSFALLRMTRLFTFSFSLLPHEFSPVPKLRRRKHLRVRKLNRRYGVYSDVGKSTCTDFGSVEAEI